MTKNGIPKDSRVCEKCDGELFYLYFRGSDKMGRIGNKFYCPKCALFYEIFLTETKL